MADDGRTRDRPVRRSFECHRLEEQLWSMAYQQICPVIRQRTKASGTNSKSRYDKPTRRAAKQARRA